MHHFIMALCDRMHIFDQQGDIVSTIRCLRRFSVIFWRRKKTIPTPEDGYAWLCNFLEATESRQGMTDNPSELVNLIAVAAYLPIHILVYDLEERMEHKVVYANVLYLDNRGIGSK